MLLYRAFHARGGAAPARGGRGLGPGQPKLLSYLAAHGPSRQKQLADYFDVDPAAVSRMVEGLRRGGFVTTRPDESSRRCELVELARSRGARPARHRRNTAARWRRSGCSTASTRGNGSSLRVS